MKYAIGKWHVYNPPMYQAFSDDGLSRSLVSADRSEVESMADRGWMYCPIDRPGTFPANITTMDECNIKENDNA